MLTLGIASSACQAADMLVVPVAPAVQEAGAVPSQILVMLHLPAPHFRPDANYGGHYADDSGRSARHRIAQELARAYGLTLLNDWPMAVLGVDCYVMGVPASASPAHVMESLSRDARVEWVQAMEIFQARQQDKYPDPLFPVQPVAREWHLAEIHKTATGRNIKVAVVDSGIEDRHPDLQGQVALKENFVDGNPYVAETHGTAVAGIIAAREGNGIGIVGVAPGAKLLALRACWEGPDKNTQCNSFTLGKAINFAITHGANVINLSLSGPPDRLLQRLLDAALSRGIAVIAAVDPHSLGGGFPASYPGVMAVSDGGGKGGSTKVFIAPGRDIPTTVPGSQWRFVSGSSYAAAHVSGMMALLLELRPVRNTPRGQGEVVVNAIDVIAPLAAGAIDICATMTQTIGKCLCSCISTHASKENHSL